MFPGLRGGWSTLNRWENISQAFSIVLGGDASAVPSATCVSQMSQKGRFVGREGGHEVYRGILLSVGKEDKMGGEWRLMGIEMILGGPPLPSLLDTFRKKLPSTYLSLVPRPRSKKLC